VCKVKRSNLIEKVNVTSLMLERLTGLLEKKNGEYIKVESINTDASNDQPPDFLGLSTTRRTAKADDISD
jgi:hypothetical protein